ncbi:hypothetical protein HHK36_007677 [Tetracentron sinense]|uniref:CCHC-type domain-containing protein n=1 Tax=Tetracentron sinense TaxID=13715 RepID=A0A834ZK73_TETSI|nr:hypothetical protein HHK36_007677 [Tetracentron sinense]
MDLSRVLSREPWCFMGYPLLLARWQPEISPLSIPLSSLQIWVQLDGLAPALDTSEIGTQLCNSLGQVLSVDGSESGLPKWGKFLCVQVCMEVFKPLMAGKFIRSLSLGQRTVQFRYERLPRFCFGCGRLGHTLSNCSDHQEPGTRFGAWLWAESPKIHGFGPTDFSAQGSSPSEPSGSVAFGSPGPSFTWSNKQLHPNTILERLDRAMANDDWIQHFPMATVRHLPFCSSDHWPLLLDILAAKPRGRTPFRYKAMWRNHPQFSSIMKETCRIAALAVKLDQVTSAEELYWHQRSRVQWLKSGDQNTKISIQQPSIIVAETFCPVFARLMVPTRLSPNMLSSLNCPFSEAEISSALSQIGPLKAPGPNGYPAQFFQSEWSTIGSDIVQVIEQLLQEREAILAIHPSRRGVEDKWVWHFDPKGRFYVKLAYQVATNGGSSPIIGIGATSVPPDSVLWKSIWQAKIPRKIQFFLWRGCSNALVAGSILARRHIAMGVSCPWCGDIDESIEHCLMLCNFARAVLFSSLLAIYHQPNASQSFREWWLFLVNRLQTQPDKDTLVLNLASILWYIWKACNEKLFSSLSSSPRSIAARASAYAAEVQSVWSPTHAISPHPVLHFWVPPPLGLIKLNCDGAFFVGESIGGAGVVGRDSVGSVLDFRVQVVRCASAIMAEAKAIVFGISLAGERGWSNIVVESDSLSLILALQSPGEVFLLEVAVLLEDLRLRVAICSFASVSFSFSPRAANGLAHWLASSSLSNFRLGLGVIPPSFRDVCLRSGCDVHASPGLSVLSSPRKHVESSLSSHTNESGHFNWGENLAATAESCPWVADEKVCSSNKQNTSTMNRGELQKRKGFMKGRCGNTLVASERPKVVPSSRKEENPQKRCVRSGDSAKYMSYVKISRKQHQIVKSMKQSADGIQTKSLNHVLGHIKSFQVQPYEAFEEEERKKLHEHWLHLANRGIPAAFADWRDRQLQRQQLTKSLELEMAEKKKPLMAKDEKEANSGTGLLEQRDNGETDHEPIMDIRSYEDDEESVPSSTRSQPLQQIPLLNGHHELDLMDMDLEEDNGVMLKPEVTTPNPPEYLGNINSTDTIERGFPVPSAKDGWVAVGMPDSYYHRTSVSHGYTSSSEMSLRQPQPTEERPACLVDLESDILEDVGEDLLHGPSNDVVSALHVDKGGSFFSSYTNRDSNELLHPFFKGQEILPSYPHEHQQPGLRFSTTSNGSLETGQLPGHFQEQQQQLLEQRHMREKELYMHHMNQKNMYSNGGRYSISSQELFSPVDVQDWAVDPVHISTPLQPPLNSGGLLGQNWFPGEHRARGVWFGMDGTGTPGQCLGNGSNADESLFSVLSQWNGLQSYSSYNSMSATEQYVPARNFVGGEIPGNNGIFSQTTHQLNYLSGREAPAASALRTNNMPWMNSQHQNSGLHDSIGKPFLRSWNQ